MSSRSRLVPPSRSGPVLLSASLRQRAYAGDGHTLRRLAGWLADHDCAKERALLVDAHSSALFEHSDWLVETLAQQGRVDELPARAELGDRRTP